MIMMGKELFETSGKTNRSEDLINGFVDQRLRSEPVADETAGG